MSVRSLYTYLHKLFSDQSFVATYVIFMAGLIVSVMLFQPFNPSLHHPHNTQHIESGAVLGRQYPLPEADIKASDGGTVTVESVTAIVSEATFNKDVYMRVNRTARGNPISVQGLWQISDIWDVRLRYMSNDNEVPTPETYKNYILSFPYSEQFLVTDQGQYFPENTLKLIRGQTVTGPWEVLDASVVDLINNTVSVITNKGGYYMVSGGFYEAAPPTEATKTVSSKTSAGGVGVGGSSSGLVLQENEVVVTVTPSPTPTLSPELSEDSNGEEVGESDNDGDADLGDDEKDGHIEPARLPTDIFMTMYTLLKSYLTQ